MLLKKRTKSLTEFTAKLLTVLFSSFELWFKHNSTVVFEYGCFSGTFSISI